MVQRYKRPPITEAVVEVRMASPINRELLDKLQKRLLQDYPLPPQRTFNMHVEIGEETAKVSQVPLGYRLTSPNASDLVSISPIAIGTSRLPPYEGWEPFIVQARRNWEVWKRIVGWREIARIGVRYVNRIDVPNPTEQPLDIDDYLKFGLVLPEAGIPPVEHFAINTQAPLGKDECKLVLNASSTPSPLVKTASFILDIDVSLDVHLPQNDEGLWGFVDRMRVHKNLIFEACITDRTRALFS